MNARPPADPFAVPRWIDWLGASAEAQRGLWVRLGDVETSVLAQRIAEHLRAPAPIYVSGLARSGSTLLLELLAAHADCASHVYRDYPLVLTPYFWNRFLDRAGADRGETVLERAHGDGMQVSSMSPEAVEEPVWMAFFDHLHDPGRSNVLDGTTVAPAFERFYRHHIAKVTWLRGGSRYLAKGNYDITRLEYLAKLFPRARFVIPVRDPIDHVASLARQHARFRALHAEHPRSLRYMQRVGHFEFGLDRRAINVGAGSQVEAIQRDWAEGREIDGLARLWQDLHRFVAERLDATLALREASIVVRHEDLAAAPHANLSRLFAHCGLTLTDDALDTAAGRLREPRRDTHGLDEAAVHRIRELTRDAAGRFG